MSKNIKLNMSRRIRRTPYTNMVEEHGVSDFTVVNHMLLPKGFKNTVETDYWHLSKDVQIWDVSCQRQVQISGPDASKLVQKLTPRSIQKMETFYFAFCACQDALGAERESKRGDAVYERLH